MADPAPRVTAPASRRRGPASTEEGQRSRDRVLQAAFDLIIEVGIDRVRLAEVARRAGMSSGQVMYYFTSKEHILLETLAWQEHQDLLRRRATLTEVPGAWQKLEQFIGLYLPADPADPSWILWLEAWARVPHNQDVSQFRPTQGSQQVFRQDYQRPDQPHHHRPIQGDRGGQRWQFVGS